MAATISSHNKTLLAEKPSLPTLCHLVICRAKTSYPMKGLWRKNSIIYKAILTSDGISKNYHDCSGTEFTTRFCNHNQSFKYWQKCNAAELSKGFWQAKDAGKNSVIKWSIAAGMTPYYPGARWCNLCLAKNSLPSERTLPPC